MTGTAPVFVCAGEREDGCLCPHCGQAVRTGDPVAVCRQCGSLHHRPCWDRQERCGSYTCAPARVAVPAQTAGAWTITPEELGRAVPLPPRQPWAPTVNGTGARPVPELPRTNRLAIAGFVTALAGIPLFGAVTGLVAILLGCLALGSLRSSKQKGTVLAFLAIFIGLADVVGWIILLYTMLSRPAMAFLPDMQIDPVALEGLDPTLARAMRATVILETDHGAGVMFGSGVILDLKGQDALLVTNRHVIDPDFSGDGKKGRAVDDLASVRVRFINTPQSSKGRVVWLADGGIDLALVKVNGDTTEARAARWQPHRPLHIGDPVFAIGNPHRLGWTHTQGAVSQLRRMWLGGHRVSVIQTQAALNPGNSGGGLFDKHGFLVGINTWVKDKREAEGLGFAIALDTLLDLGAPDLRGLPAGNDPEKR